MATESGVAGERYEELVREWPLRPLASEADLDSATAMLHRLLDLGRGRRSADESKYMHALGTLIAEYEDVHWPVEDETDTATE